MAYKKAYTKTQIKTDDTKTKDTNTDTDTDKTQRQREKKHRQDIVDKSDRRIYKSYR
jgi:hypothetical protein